MSNKSKLKVYAYVDETGQDTRGALFLVATVVIVKGRDELRKDIQQLEHQSGRKKRKWTHSRRKEREKYMELLLANKKFKRSLYYSSFSGSTDFADLTILATARAINERVVGDYKATILVDGLQKKLYPPYARGLRSLKIKAHKVRGLRDESDEFIRLADSVAGFARGYINNEAWIQPLYNKAVTKKFIKEVK